MSEPHENPVAIPSSDQVRQWHQHILELMDGGATVNQLGKFVITETQYDELHAPLELNTASSENKTSPKTNVEINFDHETLNQLLDSTDFVMHSYAGGSHDYGLRRGETGIDRRGPDLNAQRLIDQVRFTSEPDKAFAKRNIPEVLTIQEYSAQVWNDLKRPAPQTNRNMIDDIRSMSQAFAQDKPTALIRYSALGTESFPYYDSHERVGNATRFGIILPLETAQSLFDTAAQDPEIIHTLVDIAGIKAMNKNLPYDEQMKPPIGNWRAANGGKIPMAFQNSLLQDPAQATVVEY